PSSSSAIPAEYVSAESNIVTPASRQTSTRRAASSASLCPNARNISPPPPNVAVPRLSTGTLNPDRPSRLYSIRSLLRHRHATPGGPGPPEDTSRRDPAIRGPGRPAYAVPCAPPTSSSPSRPPP